MMGTSWSAAGGLPEQSPGFPYGLVWRDIKIGFLRKPFSGHRLQVHRGKETKMMKAISLALTVALVAGVSLAQSSSPQTGGSAQNAASQPGVNTPRFSPGTDIRAELDKTVDAKKAKPGDAVYAKTLDELKSGTEVVAPRGAKILGHVVAAAPHEKNSPSRLEIAFDKLDLGNGSEIPMQAAIQALAKPVTNIAAGADNMGQPMGGYTPMGPGNRTAGMQPGTMGQPAGPANTGNTGNAGGMPAPNSSNGGISPNAQGVAGISGVSLSPGPAQDSVLTSEKHNVKLEGGTQMILRVQ
jgi:hypothetical protein